MKRKTIEVEKMRVYVNDHLKRTDKWATQEFKAGMCTMLESMLMLTENYRGYFQSHWMTGGGYEAWDAAGKPEGAEKEKYIYGPKGREGANYDRQYY